MTEPDWCMELPPIGTKHGMSGKHRAWWLRERSRPAGLTKNARQVRARAAMLGAGRRPGAEEEL